MAAVSELVSGLDAELVRMGYRPSTLVWRRGSWRRLEGGSRCAMWRSSRWMAQWPGPCYVPVGRNRWPLTLCAALSLPAHYYQGLRADAAHT